MWDAYVELCDLAQAEPLAELGHLEVRGGVHHLAVGDGLPESSRAHNSTRCRAVAATVSPRKGSGAAASESATPDEIRLILMETFL